MPAAGAGDTIANWDATTLTRFIRDILQNQTELQYPYLQVDELRVRSLLQVDDRSVFIANRVPNYISQVGQPAFTNAWVNNGGGYEGAGFFRSPDGWVQLTGAIKSGAVGSAAFTLPPNYRPAFLKTLPVISNNAIGRLDIGTDGTVTPIAPSSNVYVVLDGIRFKSSVYNT